MPLSAGDRLGQYTIVRRLGQGGMGTVYQARASNGRLVAIKVPFETLLDDPGTQARYEREQEVSRALDHPGVQRLIETGHLEGSRLPYTVLEWIDGGLLREHLYQGRALEIDEAVRIATQLCAALEYCHARGIVHRDLKPDNVLVGADGRVTLMDFGAALLEGARKITTASLSTALGTPDYMSPEQVQGQRGDPRSDVYALGIMLYEMLTGHPPFSGDNALAVMAQHVQAPPPPLRSKNKRVPAGLEAVVGKALRKDPGERYQAMGAFQYDLEHLDEVDVGALGATPGKRKAPGLTTIVLVAAGALLVVLGIVLGAQLAAAL